MADFIDELEAMDADEWDAFCRTLPHRCTKCLDMIDPEIDDTIAKFNVCADCYDDTMKELP